MTILNERHDILRNVIRISIHTSRPIEAEPESQNRAFSRNTSSGFNNEKGNNRHLASGLTCRPVITSCLTLNRNTRKKQSYAYAENLVVKLLAIIAGETELSDKPSVSTCDVDFHRSIIEQASSFAATRVLRAASKTARNRIAERSARACWNSHKDALSEIAVVGRNCNCNSDASSIYRYDRKSASGDKTRAIDAFRHSRIGHPAIVADDRIIALITAGFHEAVGEAIALSVATPRHLQTLGLANKFIDERSADINYLFSLAMDKLVLLPFSITMDRWRWDVFRGYVNREEYNCHWHRLKEQYTGTKPPVLRSEDDFDPGAKYHIPANIPYIR